MDFEADSIQGVLFVAPGQHQVDALQLWSRLFHNESPDGYQKASISSPTLASNAQGIRDGHQIAITVQVGRIDVVISVASASADKAGPPRIADYVSATSTVTDLLKRIAAEGKVFRAALVLDLAKTILPGTETEETLKYLPGFPFPKNVSDINVQFNSRKPFSFDAEFEMNRLCAWTAGQVGFVRAGPHAPPVTPQPMVMTPYFGVKIDVNSAPHVPLRPEYVAAAIDEVSAEALAIAKEGVERLGS